MALLLTSISYNIETGKQSNASGLSKSAITKPVVYLKQKDMIINVDFVRSNGSAVTDLFSLTDSWGFSADDDYDVASALMLQSLDAEFNIANDRSDLDVVNGKISFRIDADVTELSDGLGVLPEIDLKGEIQVFNSGEANPKAVFRLDMVARNLVDNASAGPSPTPAASFYTKTQADALFAGKEDLQVRPSGTIDLTSAATTGVYTIPSARKSQPMSLAIETTALATVGAMPDIEVKLSDGTILAAATTMLVAEGVVGGVMMFDLSGVSMVAATVVIQVRVAVAGASTTHDATFRLHNLEVDV